MRHKAVIVASVFAARFVFAAAMVEVGTLDLPTYPFSDPDPVPCTGERRYPYFRFDGSSHEAVTQSWQCVILENDRIRVTMMPQIGGKVWGALDKESGREFIYFNHCAKFRNIAMRGPWCSGGIEFNFGIFGHAPTTATPVDWCVRTNSDGSASCFVSATEWINRTTWQVEVRLPPDADWFQTRTIWFNGANITVPRYNWMTAAYSARGKPEMLFPGTSYIGHEGDAHAWPVDAKGRDCHIYENNNFGGSKSYHVLNGNHSFFGIWWPSAGIGSYHRSEEKFGRKIWIWALSREGGLWEDLLTDTDGQYVELQSGLAFNQPSGKTYRTPFKHPPFAPGATETFEETWGVMRTLTNADSEMDPSTFAGRPLSMPKGFDWDSAYGLFVRGEQALLTRDDCEGEKVLLECLQKDPSFAPALDALAGLAVRRGDCVRARELCAQALAIDTYDPAANYLDGLASDAQGLAAESHDRLYMAASSPLYRTAALARLAKMAMRREDWSAADELAKKSMQSNNFNFDAWLVRIAAARKRGDARAARRISDLALQVFPLFHGARFESKMLGDIDEDGFRSGVRNEFPDQTYMELGTWYENAGLFAEAKELFGYASNPLAKIRMAWMLGRSGMDSATASKALDAAAASSVAFVLPFRRETLPALEWAVSANPSWKFRYLLALHRAASGRNEDADRLLDTCDDADEAVVFLYRATRRNGAARLHDLMKAQSLDDGWRVGCGLAEHYRKEGNSSAAAEIAIGYLGRFPGNNELEFLYTRSLCELERYEEAANFLKTMRVLPSEHGRNAHDIWCTAWKGIARQALEAGDVKKADEALARYREYPENLGLGKPFPPDR